MIRKIPKISPGAYILKGPFWRAYFWGAYIRRGLSTEGKLRLEIDGGSLIVGCKFTTFALFYFLFEGNFPILSPQGAYIWRGDLTEGFLRYRFGGLIFGGAYTWSGLFSEFYGTLSVSLCIWIQIQTNSSLSFSVENVSRSVRYCFSHGNWSIDYSYTSFHTSIIVTLKSILLLYPFRWSWIPEGICCVRWTRPKWFEITF